MKKFFGLLVFAALVLYTIKSDPFPGPVDDIILWIIYFRFLDVNEGASLGSSYYGLGSDDEEIIDYSKSDEEALAERMEMYCDFLDMQEAYRDDYEDDWY